MKIYEFDRDMYIRLGDLSHLVRQMIEGDKTLAKALGPMMDRILEGRRNACENGEEVKTLYERVDDEFYNNKFVVVIRDEVEENGKTKKRKRFFQRFSTEKEEAQLRAEGKTEEEIQEALLETAGELILCDRAFQAEYFENYGFASATANYLKHARGMDAEVSEAWLFSPNAIKRFKKLLQEWKKEDAEEKEAGKGENG